MKLITHTHCEIYIFTTPDGSDVFEIEEDKIRIKDWEGYIYTLYSKGKLISETKDI